MADDGRKVLGLGQLRSGGADNVIAYVDAVLARAADVGASDVHFEPTGQALVVRFRLDGRLQTVDEAPKALSENVIARLKVLGELLTYRNDIPQEGRMEALPGYAGQVLDERLAVFPTIHGQRAVVRLFYRQAALEHLQELGFAGTITAALEEIAQRQQGLLLLTGPAGSGKSTTLAAVLRQIVQRQPGKSIVALEDPVERHIEGVTQVQIQPYGELTFVKALRSLLRQDPEVLMIGEIRDAETARIGIEAGLTGHLLLSTLHSGTCAGALLRLLEMGVEPYQVTSTVLAVVNQRLVRRLCAACKEPAGEGAGFAARGCGKCLETGYHGRTPAAELVTLDGQLRRAILAKADLDELEAILDQRGHMSLYQDGLRLVQEGVTSIEEVEQVCGGGR